MRHGWIVALALVACGKASTTAPNATATGSATRDAAAVIVASPTDASVAAPAADAVVTDAAVANTPPPPRFPTCKVEAQITEIPDPPFDVQIPDRAGNVLVVGSKGKKRRYATYDPAKRTWSELPPLELAGSTDIIPYSSATKSQLVVTYEKDKTFGAFTLDLAKRVWKAVPPFSSPYPTNFVFTVGETIVVMPYRPCGYWQFQLAHRLDRTPAFVSIGHTLTPSARAHGAIVDGKWVVWGGDVVPDAPATGDIGCDSDKQEYRPTNEGAIYDPATSKWTAMAPGPLDAEQFEPAPGQLYARAGTALWRYDLAKNAWTELGKLPAELARPLARDEMYHVSTEGHAVGNSFVIVHSSIRVGIEVLVDRKTGAMRELPAPALDIAEAIVVDDKRLLLLPRGLSKLVPDNTHAKAPDPVGYLHDTTTGGWCELPWSSPHPFDYAFSERIGNKLVLWDHEGAGIEVTIP